MTPFEIAIGDPHIPGGFGHQEAFRVFAGLNGDTIVTGIKTAIENIRIRGGVWVHPIPVAHIAMDIEVVKGDIITINIMDGPAGRFFDAQVVDTNVLTIHQADQPAATPEAPRASLVLSGGDELVASFEAPPPAEGPAASPAEGPPTTDAAPPGTPPSAPLAAPG